MIKRLGLLVGATIIWSLSTNGTVNAANSRDTLTRTDWVFLQMAGAAAKTDMTRDRLARDSAADIRVRQFATLAAQDHERYAAELTVLADQKDVTLRDPDAWQRDTTEKLTRLAGRAFDRLYLDALVTDHQKSLFYFEKALQSKDAAIRVFAEHVTPTLRDQLQRARDLQRLVPGAGK